MSRIEDLLNSLLNRPESQGGLLSSIGQGSAQKTASDAGTTFGQVLAQVSQDRNGPSGGASGQGQAPTPGVPPVAIQGSEPSSNLPPGTDRQQEQTPGGAPLSTGAQVPNFSQSVPSLQVAPTPLSVVAPSIPQPPPLNLSAFETDLTVTQITVKETLHLTGANAVQLKQAEQALSAMMNGLVSLLQSLGAVQNGAALPDQFSSELNQQMGLQPADLQVLDQVLQPFTQNLPEGQNPLDLNAEQQSRLLAEMIQQMLGAQQVLFGGQNASLATDRGGVSGVGEGAPSLSAGSQAAFLQMNFAASSFNETVAGAGKFEQVTIDLQSFKMSAALVQVGGDGKIPSTLMNPIALGPSSNVQALVNGSVAGDQTMSRNFKELVQLLFTSGVTQAALSSFMNHAQGAQAPVTTTGSNGTNPQVSMDRSLGQILPSSESLVPPVNSVEAPLSGGTAPTPFSTASRINELASNLAGSASGQGGTEGPQAPVQLTSSVVAPSNPSTEEPTSRSTLGPALPLVVPVEPSSPHEVQQQIIQNDAVSRLNSVSLHATQGSLTFGDIHPTSSLQLTMNQVTAATAATQLNSPVPAVMSGSPSVPQNSQPVTPVEVLLKTRVIQVETAVAIAQTQGTQGAAHEGVPQGNAQGQPPPPVPVTSTPVPTVEVDRSMPLLNSANGTNEASSVTATVAPGVPNVVVSNGVLPNPVPSKTDVLPGSNAQAPVSNQPEVNSRPLSVPHSVVTAANPPLTPSSVTQKDFLGPNILPAPVSTTPNVPSTIVVGEGIKTEIQPEITGGITNPGQPTDAAAFQPANTIKTNVPEGVTPVVDVAASDIQDQVSTVTDKTESKITTPFDILSNIPTALAGAPHTIVGAASFQTVVATSANNPRFNLDAAQLFNLVSGQIVSQMGQAKSVSRLSFQLIPESLGKVTVQMALVDQALTARIFVSSPEVREAVQTHLVDLRASLSQSGLQIDQLQVQVQGGGANLLGQYYQYQQEGSSYRGSVEPPLFTPETPENKGVLAPGVDTRSLVNLLA